MVSLPLSTIDQCVKQSHRIVEDHKEILQKTQRRWNVSYPSKISRLIKSALLQNIGEKEKWQTFRELSDFIGQELYTVLDRWGAMYTIQDTQKKKYDIIFGKWSHGGQRVWYDGQYFDEFSRSGNLYKHIMNLKERRKKYGYMNVEDGYISEQEHKEWSIIDNMHDFGETKHTDIESILKDDVIRNWEDSVFKQEMDTLRWLDRSPYIKDLHTYSKKWEFKWNEHMDVLLWDIPQYHRDYSDLNFNYNEWLGILYEALLGGLSHLLASDAVVEFRNKVVPVLQVRCLREQIKDNYRDLLLIPQFLKDHRVDVEKWERHERVHQTKNIKFDQWLDIIQRSLEKLDNEMNR